LKVEQCRVTVIKMTDRILNAGLFESAYQKLGVTGVILHQKDGRFKIFVRMHL
jgi:hypothetical protein